LKIQEVVSLYFPEVKVIRFCRFMDHRGYFSEIFRKSDFQTHPLTTFLSQVDFVQSNESFSRAGTIRGLHLQWNPYVGKLVRTVAGHMVDLVMDIRKGSPHFGKIIAYDMSSQHGQYFSEWIWIPPGFAHGNFFLSETTIEYFCSGEYNPACEAGISPLAHDVDWTVCDSALRNEFLALVARGPLMSDKDAKGMTVAQWQQDERSRHFTYGESTLVRLAG
jgi:dTDP-4-dehydrorhamnose 3,5-epimerase